MLKEEMVREDGITPATKLRVSEVMECRRLLYLSQLRRFKIPTLLAQRMWTQESDLLDITAHLILGSPAKSLPNRDELRKTFFEHSPSAEEALDTVFAVSTSKVATYLLEVGNRGFIPNYEELVDDLLQVFTASRMMLLAALKKDVNNQPYY